MLPFVSQTDIVNIHRAFFFKQLAIFSSRTCAIALMIESFRPFICREVLKLRSNNDSDSFFHYLGRESSVWTSEP